MKSLYSSVLAVVAGLALAPGISTAQDIDRLAPQARVVRIAAGGMSYLGVNLREIDADRARELKLKEEAGVEITRVEEDSPASKAGLKVNDVILNYNGARVEGMEQFSRFVRETPPGREVKLTISRDGNAQTIMARIGSRKTPFAVSGISGMQMPRIEMPAIASMPDLPRGIMMWRTAVLGIEAEALRGQLADFFGVKEGVLVRSVMKETPAAKAGLRAGDVILRVGSAKVATPGDVTSAIRAAKDRQALSIVVMRDHKELTVTASINDDRSDWDMPVPPGVNAPGFRM